MVAPRIGMAAPRPHQARNLAFATSLCPVLDVEHPSSNATKMNHVYVAALDAVQNLKLIFVI